MLERFAVQFLLAMLEAINRRPRAVDSDVDRSRLLLAASHLRQWLRENGARPKG